MEDDWNYTYETIESLNKKITQDELEHAIQSAKSKSAPGMDFISYEIIKQLPQPITSKIRDIFNCIMDSGRIPESWKNYKVCFIPKTNGKGYRPIAMSSCLLKTLERIINDRLSWWVESVGILPHCFNGFRRGKSCYDNLLDLRLEMDIARIQGLSTGVSFIDITEAYDNVNIDTLTNKLKLLKIPPNIVRFIKSTLKCRTLAGYAENTQLGVKTTYKGLPQGSILSPLLFNLYMTGIERALPPDISLSSFADDFRISYSNASIPAILGNIKRGLVVLEKFLKDKDLSISYEKTKLMLFNYKRKKDLIRPHTKQINIRNHIIKNDASAKYLGVTRDYRLNWEEHINNVRKKSVKLVNILATIAKFKWGAHPTTLLRIYKGLVRPAIEWAGFLFNPSSYEQLSKLNTIQNSALRISLGCLRTTPINVLLHLSGVTTLKERITELSSRFLAKKMSYDNNTLEFKLKRIQALKNQPHVKVHQTQDANIYHLWQDLKQDWTDVEKNDKLETFNVDYEALFINRHAISNLGPYLQPPDGDPNRFRPLISEHFPHHLLAYTDGSLNRDTKLCGVGIFPENYPHLSRAHSINPSNTIYSAEMFAVKLAINTFLSTDNPSDILICTDSLSAVKKLQQNGLGSRMSKTESEIRQLTSEGRKGRDI